MMPIRIQRRRTRGWRMPPNTVSVTRPGKWGNPWKIGEHIGSDADGDVFADAAECVQLFRFWACDPDDPLDTTPLRGKNLACWCPIIDRHGNYVHCHADVLLSIANDIPMDEVIRENTRLAKGKAMR